MLHRFQDLAINILLRKNIDKIPKDFAYQVEDWLYVNLTRFNTNASKLLDSRDEEVILALIKGEFDNLVQDQELAEQVVKMTGRYLIFRKQESDNNTSNNDHQGGQVNIKKNIAGSVVTGPNAKQIHISQGDYINGNQTNSTNYYYDKGKGNNASTNAERAKTEISSILERGQVATAIESLLLISKNDYPRLSHRVNMINNEYKKLVKEMMESPLSLEKEEIALAKVKVAIERTLDLLS